MAMQLLAPPQHERPPLLKLPLEILMLLFHHGEPEDQVMLAFSCKALLGVAALCDLQLPDPSRHRAPWASNQEQYSASCCCTCPCDIAEGLLQRLYRRDFRGRVNRKASLCVDCLRYRPTRKRYWAAKLAEMSSHDLDRFQEKQWTSAVKLFGARLKAQCPDCQIREEMWMGQQSWRLGFYHQH